MKKSMKILALGALLSLPTFVMAEVISPSAAGAQSQGGFQGPSDANMFIKTVAEAKNANDDTKVVLTGKLKSALGHEKYLFTDTTGEITVEIDNDQWYGRTVTTSDSLILRGEVDKDRDVLTIDVDSIEVK
ncbi:YgiW/YdeI family stress tolerance OB fold protein [Vibrio rumoiensis]|uniref:Uncharacterized protein n=1 Tax=Vibrio rumoiensis 1S-45 TaxID=1188252 RepID=A0A1E5E6T3_9VIBR|nr:NirD/YgiW/YdeI family stress tolerance protein [Vibrio rumoiensis]OEF30236.1 hypothetical protein A1QC_00115 [Vibrio rumoiensis 1S-45]